jgi:ABC-type multidrug transport system ATPase subunit
LVVDSLIRSIAFSSVVAVVDNFPVLAGVNLEVEKGEVILVQGPNGAGKTSLLRTCAGLIPIVSGRAVVLGYDLTLHRGGVRSVVGMLGHRCFLYDELTVEENLAFFMRSFKVPISKADEHLERFALVGRLRSTPVSKLSEGQRRKLQIAMVFARSPGVLLLDEPYASLDTGSRALLDQMIKKVTETGTTVLLVSHSDDAIADRKVYVAGGQVVSHVA